jgi:very-short-patch-repair endonuclease
MQAPDATIIKARRLRRTLSPPEAALWLRLRARGQGRPTFRRQHPVGPYILDFYCAKARLAIEIDGEAHDMGDRPERDARRDAWLLEQGIETIHIRASDLRHSFDETLDSIERTVQARYARQAPSTAFGGPPPPPAAGEGERSP